MPPARPFIIVSLALLTLGCSSKNAVDSAALVAPPANTPAMDAPIIPNSERPVADKSTRAVEPKSSEALKLNDAKSAPTLAEPAEEKSAVAEYQPPFPDRVDLFVPPKRQGVAHLKEGEAEDHVELLGFIRVDRPQVVLSVNGQIAAIPEGDTQLGVEVISIQQPKAVLQRGRQRWQASIEN